MKRYIYMFMFAVCTPFMCIQANDIEYFYYYKGEKKPLIMDSTRLTIISNSEIDTTRFYLGGMKLVQSQQRREKRATENKDVYFHSEDTRPYFSTIELSSPISLRGKNILDLLESQEGIIQVSPSFRKNNERFDVTNNIYVKLKSLEDTIQLKKLSAKYSLDIIGCNRFMPLWYTLSCTQESKLSSIAAANLFFETGFFEAAEPEFVNGFRLLSDPLYSEQWALKNTGQNEGVPRIDINIEEAWSITKGNDSIHVAIFDGGIYNHSDLDGRISDYFDPIYGNRYIVYDSHGTLCAGIVAAQHNDIGIKGIAPNTKLVSLSHPFGSDQDYTEDFVDGFNWAWQYGKSDIISCSWYSLYESTILDNAIESALINGREGRGCVIVFSSGNDDENMVTYPGNSHPDIIVVGAVSNNGERMSDEYDWGSNYGQELDVVAPGVDIKTTNWYGGYIEDSGTSFACPHVSGLAALILSVNPNLANVEVNDIIESTARKLHPTRYQYETTAKRYNGAWNVEMGYGLIDATAAVKAASTYDCNGIHISNQIITCNDTLHICNLIIDNFEVPDSVSFLIKKSQKVNLNSNVRINKGAVFGIKNM